MIAALAFSVDMAFMLSNHTRLQTVADAAAMSAAFELKKGGTYQDAKTAAETALVLNGISGTVDVGHKIDGVDAFSPSSEQSSFFVDNIEYVGVTVHGSSPRFFAPKTIATALSNQQAHAVAYIGTLGAGGTGGSCPGIYVNSSKKPIDLKQNSTFTVTDGGIYINVQNFPKVLTGTGTVVSAEWIEVTGGSSGVGNVIPNPPVQEVAERETPDPAPTNLPIYNRCVLNNGVYGCDCVRQGSSWKCNSNIKTTKIIEPALYRGTLKANGDVDIPGLQIISTSGVTFSNKGSSPTDREQYYYKIEQGLTIKNSSVYADNVIIDTRADDYINMEYGHITGVARIYVNSFDITQTSTVNITVFKADEGFYECGKKIADRTKLVE